MPFETLRPESSVPSHAVELVPANQGAENERTFWP